MPVFSAKDSIVSGLPLGGIGAGKLEILPNGLLNAFTFLNNWSHPFSGIGDAGGILGYHFGVFAEAAGAPRRKAFLLQTVPLRDLPTVRSIRCQGFFPKLIFSYHEPSLGLEVALEAFSSWAPSDVKNSSLPAVFFKFKVKNRTRRPLRAGLLFIGRNICGEWCVGRENRIEDGPKETHLEFFNHDPTSRDSAQGTIRFSFEKRGWQTSFIESWNAVTKNFHFDSKNIWLPAWEYFVKQGRLPNSRQGAIAQGENCELCGAVSATTLLQPRSEKEWSFIATWNFPQAAFGHRYNQWFKSAAQVHDYVQPKRNAIEAKIEKWHELVFATPFPQWFQDALLANLAPFFSSSWYVRDGRFAFYEAPVTCPLMGTLDVGFYGSIPLSYFFPELEMSQMAQFARAQRSDGYVPHDLGKNRLDLPSNGTTFYFWKDLNPKFILMVYRDFLWSGDKTFLKKMYPHVKKALAWSLGTDKDGNGLPDNEGADQTFDLWPFHGTNAYTSGIFLAAVLAGRKMAGLLGDPSFADDCEKYFLKGRNSFEKELWNGEYFGEPCALSQLNGQWYADLLGLGDIADPAKIKTALTGILKRTSRHSRFGLVNAVVKNGRLDNSNDHSKNVWAGMNYAFVGLALMRGFPLKNLLNVVRRLWDNSCLVQKNPWNQPDTVDSKTGRYVFGDAYYRNMAIWSIPIAYSLKHPKMALVLKKMRTLNLQGGASR